jgi:RHS repeat-associated protein
MTVIHDADGNMTTGPNPLGTSLANYTYDARNRLTTALGTSYVYDADGQRVGSSEPGETTTFAVDVGSELSKVLVRTKNGIPTRYVWGLGLLYEVNGTGSTSTTVTYHHDATGSTIALTDDTAEVIERIGYTPWGQINHRINLAGTSHDTPFLFTGFFGNQTDDNGLLYMRNRYYHPLIGRFLNADPAQEGMNWYGYAGGNPIGMVDPMGLGITSALNGIQTTLSFLGMTPVFGAVFDVVNAGISIGRGNYVDAGFNLASAIPGIGDFAAGAKLIGGGAAAYGGARLLNNAGYSFSGNLYSGIPIPTKVSNPSFSVGRHIDMPSPRPNQQSHHGVMSAYMSHNFSNYNANLAPAILMPTSNHRATYGVYNTWRAEARRSMGGSFSWSKVSETQMRGLSELMFNAASVPGAIRQQYWKEYARMTQALKK